MTRQERIGKVVQALRRATRQANPTSVGTVARTRDPFKVLISCLISLRTKDEVTGPAAARLFRLAATPRRMLRLTPRAIEKAIYPAGFYRTKARTILGVCRSLLERYRGTVPGGLEDLLSLKGVGRKTANLVVTLGFGQPGICVDTHVHRISNRLGFVRTPTPEKTEFALRKVLPRRYWVTYNDLLVTFGQTVCRPLSPLCSQCPVDRYCPKVGVTRHR